MTTGCAFGETFMIRNAEVDRFFNAIALTDCTVLQLSKEVFEHLMTSSERKIFNDKKAFLSALPEFNGKISLVSSKLKQFCNSMQPVCVIKNQVIFREGEPNKKIYFVISGELRIIKRVKVPTADDKIEDVTKLFEDLQTGNHEQKKQEQPTKHKQHIVGLV